jgi:plasmid stabilization system protein ParE
VLDWRGKDFTAAWTFHADRLSQLLGVVKRNIFNNLAERVGGSADLLFSVTELRGARRVPIAGFPKHLVLYQSFPEEIVVLRIVHGARDLESLFSL